MIWVSCLVVFVVVVVFKFVIFKVVIFFVVVQVCVFVFVQVFIIVFQFIEVVFVVFKDQGSEWQIVEIKCQSCVQFVVVVIQIEKEGIFVYIKFVIDKVKEVDFKVILEVFGEVVYFDINCIKVSDIFLDEC